MERPEQGVHLVGIGPAGLQRVLDGEERLVRGLEDVLGLGDELPDGPVTLHRI